MTRSGRLFRKYALVFGLLVGAALVMSGAVQLLFSYQENQSAVLRLEQEQAARAATRIAEFVDGIQVQLRWVIPPPGIPDPALEDRRSDYQRLQRQAPEITDVTYIDPTGHEQLRVSRLTPNSVGQGIDRSRDPEFIETRSGSVWFSAVEFRGGSEPHMRIAMPEGSQKGVTVADVNLKFILEPISSIRVGSAGHAYVVDGAGLLVAHPDISLVLQRTDLSSLPQVQGALRGAPPDARATTARDLAGHDVLTAYESIPSTGWAVFVEQPLGDAFAPLYASLLRSTALLLLGLALAAGASLVLARRMTGPIGILREGAARMGAGALDQRIAVRTGDELEELADDFNRMGERLLESYATLEQKVEDRTRALAEALDQQTATANVLKLISRSAFELQPVLETVIENAAKFCRAQQGHIVLRHGDVYRLSVAYRMTPKFRAFLERQAIRRDDRGTVTGRVALERAIVHIPDVLADPEYTFREGQKIGGYRAILGVPMLHEEDPVGVIVLWRNEPRAFAQSEIKLVTTFADQAVIALQNVRLFREIQEKSSQLEVASRHKSQFLANMSHELRTPLNAIIGFSEVLLERLFGDINDKQRDYLTDILESGRHQLALINDILDLSKVEAGRMELEISEFALPDVLTSALALVRDRAMRHSIRLELRVDPGVGLARADERKVKQVVLNLLSNAVKFTPDGGTVELRAAADTTDAVEVSVRDTGMGIAPEDQARIFEEFEQTRQGAGVPGGTGLGLTLAKKFVELHGGRISVESAPGRGSVFRFTLPLAGAHVASARS